MNDSGFIRAVFPSSDTKALSVCVRLFRDPHTVKHFLKVLINKIILLESALFF